MSAYTPGPWQMSGVRQPSGNYKGHMVGPDGDGVVVVPYTDKHHAECLANAKLIAAAPELADTLQKCVDTFDDLQRVLRILNHPTLADACAVAADGSRDVLAKAGL